MQDEERFVLIREWGAKARFRLKHHTVLEISDFLRLGREMFTYLCTDQYNDEYQPEGGLTTWDG